MRLNEFADQRSYTLPPRRWQPFSNVGRYLAPHASPHSGPIISD